MQRRRLLAALGAVTLWPVTLAAQQPAMPSIGILGVGSAANSPQITALRRGLSELGFVEGKNVRFEYRGAERHNQLPGLAAALVQENVALIVTVGGTPPALAAKAATSVVPIVFGIGTDPVAFGLVASLSRPGGNITGIITLVASDIAAKRLGLLLELVPTAAVIGVLANPNNPISEPQIADLQAAARTLGRQLLVLKASTETDFAAAFAAIDQQHVDALLVAADPFFDDRRAQLVSLAARHKVPASYIRREFVTDGGFVSYGPDPSDALRQAGIYTGRILKGAKASDLPVMEPTKFELVINLKTAKTLGLNIPATLLARADEVIE